MREEPKFIRLRLWENGLEAYPTNISQWKQHSPILGPSAAMSIQDNPRLGREHAAIRTEVLNIEATLAMP
jgi:hypothetical protein